MENEPQPQIGASALEIAVLESPTSPAAPSIKDLEAAEEIPKSGGGLFGWMKDSMPKGILAKVAEKARSSVDTVITTLDPQMKEFICKNYMIILQQNGKLVIYCLLVYYRFWG
jgi:hypothetical protein